MAGEEDLRKREGEGDMQDSFELGPVGVPKHEGKETYQVSFALSGEDVDAGKHDVTGSYVQFTIRPNRVTLVWERVLNGEWTRQSSFRGGSQIRGRRVLQSGTMGEQESYVEVWRYAERGVLTDYALSLPGLADRVAEIEKALPE